MATHPASFHLEFPVRFHSPQGNLVHGCDHTRNLITNLLLFTRDYKDVGVQPPDWIGVADAVRASRTSMDLGPVSVNVTTGSLGIYADPLLRKVFCNLIDYSLRYGGPVTEIRVSAEEDAGNLVLRFEDNGSGIPCSEKERIFDRESGKNIGLGLFLAREILTITGITITETGEPDKGSRFEMTVPAGSYRFFGN